MRSLFVITVIYSLQEVPVFNMPPKLHKNTFIHC